MATHQGAYQALDVPRKEIRILNVESGSGVDPVHCTFEQVFLDGSMTLDYETVSYVWGDASKRATVLLHGEVCDVPASSEIVLRRMRSVEEVRRIWIDAICIDQNDLQERSQQVAIMGQIYSGCTTNLVWLGPDDGTGSHAIASIRAINEEMRLTTEHVKELKNLFYPGGTMTFGGPGLRTRMRESALRRFFESRWFSRVWIVQEAALSPRSVCYRGEHEIDFLEVMQAVLYIRFNSSQGAASRLMEQENMGTVGSLADWTVVNGGYHVSRSLQGRTLAALLASFRGSQAQDPRDHVFGMLGLWLAKSGATELPSDLIPDYSAPLTDVLRRAMRFAMRERGDLEILKLISHQPDEPQMPGLPTWTHRWDTPADPNKDPESLVHRERRADASMAPDMEQVLHNVDVLTVRGFPVGSITTHLPELRGKSSRSFRKHITAVEHAIQRAHKGDTQSLHQVVGLTLQAGTTSTSSVANEQESGRAYEIYKRALMNIDSAYPYHNANLAKTSAVAQKQIAAQFALAMTGACYDRKFFSATGAQFGLGPKTIQEGDLLAIVYGSPFPVVLRALKDSVDHEFVGVCYVHGIMNGEAVEKHERNGNESSLFRLR